MTVLVTGGSGFLGGAIVRHLVADGRDVLATVRSRQAAATVEALGARSISVPLDDPVALGVAMQGVETVFHVAGLNSLCPRDATRMHRVNVELPVAVVRAAAIAGVPRVVHTSSAATVGEGEGSIGSERSPHRGSFLSVYERTKYLGERAALRAGDDLGVAVVSVDPCSVQGPGRVSGTARLLLRVMRVSTAVLVPTWISLIDVDDCAQGHLLAERHGGAGQRYLLCGASLPLEQAVEMLRARTGRPHRVRWLPRAALRAAIPASALMARFGKADEAPVCPGMLKTLLHGHRYDGSKAAHELGLRYRPLEETIDRTIAWYQEHGMLNREPRN
jgi:dihydroflavonol-4-reductase